MKKILSAAMMLAFSLFVTAQNHAAAAASDKIYGCVIFSELWESESYDKAGIYEFPTSGSPKTFTPVHTQAELVANCGGVLANGLYYCTNGENVQAELKATVTVFDAATWNIRETIDAPLSWLATDLAYDPTTDNIYGCFYNEDATEVEFGTVNYTLRKRTTIKRLGLNAWAAMAVAPDGTLYAIDEDGVLNIVDKSTGNLTKIGYTGVVSAYASSAVIDHKSGKMYWTAYPENSNAGLYTVNTTTGKATKIYTFQNMEQVTGLYVPEAEADDNAPAAVSDLGFGFVNDNLTGTVTFTLPSKTYGGDELTGPLTYRVSLNDVVKASGTAEAGQTVTATVTADVSSLYDVKAWAENAAGRGARANATLFIGEDRPMPIEKIEIAHSGNTVTVTWQPATKTIHGGYINPEKLTYDVLRQASNGENELVEFDTPETSITETLPEPDGVMKYHYKVNANYDDYSTAATVSDGLILGHITPPFAAHFDDENELDLFTIEDCNNDGHVWQPRWNNGSLGVCIIYNASKPMDDWLFTPPLYLEEGKSYDFSFKASSPYSTEGENVEAFIGTEPTASAMLTRLIDNTKITKRQYVEVGKKNFVPASTGIYHFGIHACSQADTYYLFVDDIEVTRGLTQNAPDSAKVAVEPNETGELTAVITVTAPTTTVTGEPLTSIDAIDLYREAALIKTFDQVEPGKSYSFTDQVADNGTYNYRAVVRNQHGSGRDNSASAFIGLTAPCDVTNATVTETEQLGTVDLSWDAPTTDQNGRTIDPSTVSYLVVSPTGASGSLSGKTSTTIQYLENPNEQDFAYFGIYAYNEQGYAPGVVTEMVPVGKPYTLPMAESFANAGLTYIFGASAPAGSEARWQIIDPADIGMATPDNDGGMAACYSSVQGSAQLFTGKILIDNVENPTLSFYYYGIEGCHNRLDIMAKDANGTETIQSMVLDGGGNTWHQASVSLNSCKGRVIQLLFVGSIVDWSYIFIDDLRLTDPRNHDLSVADITAPAVVEAEKAFEITVNVTNSGNNDIADGEATVSLLCNGTEVDVLPIPALKSTASATLAFSHRLGAITEKATYAATVNFAADENAANNTTEEVTVSVKRPVFPTANNLTATVDGGNVSLTWDVPDLSSMKKETVTEDFEAYNAYATGNLGGWTMLDLDNLYAGSIQGVSFPYYGQTVSYFILDASNSEFDYTFDAHSGKKYLSTMFPTNPRGRTLDDWLISPRLSGDAQIIKFFARSYGTSYKEAFEVLYSMTDTNPESFQLAFNEDETPTPWTEYDVEIPEGAQYFAIRCVSYDKFMLFIDDITYEPEGAQPITLELKGYNVYRDGLLLTPQPLATAAYTDNAMTQPTHTYQVTAVYDLGESAASNKVAVNNPTRIESIIADSTVEVFTIDGRKVATDDARHLTPGIYILRSNGKTVKALYK